MNPLPLELTHLLGVSAPGLKVSFPQIFEVLHGLFNVGLVVSNHAIYVVRIIINAALASIPHEPLGPILLIVGLHLLHDPVNHISAKVIYWLVR